MEYLFTLQTLREGAGAALTPFFLIVSELAVACGIAVLAFVYWCVDKRVGAWGFFNMALGNLVTHVVKVVACVNRPWVQDARLYVAPMAAESATGYSFPSGHTTTATATYGSLAAWQRGKRAWVVVVMVVLILLTAFSRNWLGAHTLVDVAAAIVFTVLVMFITYAAMRHLDKHPQRDVVYAAVVLAICAAASVFVAVKPFPLEYLPDGSLLVDPQEMSVDFWSCIGLVVGWTVSWLVERRFIQFDCSGTRRRKAIRFLVGMLLFGVVYLALMPALVAGLDPSLGKFLKRLVAAAFVGCIYPAVIKFVQRKGLERTTSDGDAGVSDVL